MPAVPKYNQQVGPGGGGLPMAYARDATPAAFGALQGQAVSNFGTDLAKLGDEAGNIVIKRNIENIQRYSKGNASEYDDHRRNLLYGDGTAENKGFMSLNGEDSIQARQGVEDSLKKKREEIAGRTDNVHVKDLFNNYANEADRSTYDLIYNKVDQEREKANLIASATRVKSYIDDAAYSWRDEAVFNKSKIGVEEETRQQGELQGLSKDTIDKQVNQKLSALIEARITSGMQFDSKGARKIFNSYADQVNGTTKAAIQDKLDGQERQDLRDYWANEGHAEEQRVRFQKENATDFIASVGKGTFSLGKLNDAVTHHLIDGAQYENIARFAANPPGPGNKDAEVNLRLKVIRGEASYQDIQDEHSLSRQEQDTLITLKRETEKDGGVLANANVKQALHSIDQQVGGIRGPMAILNKADSKRVDNAQTELIETLTHTDPMQLTGKFIEETRLDIIKRYNSDLSMRPSEALSALPKPITWEGPKSGTKDELKNKTKQSVIKLDEKLRSGEISQQIYNREISNLKQIDDIVETMATTATP